MANNQHAEFMSLLREVVNTENPVRSISADVLDGVLLTFLQKAKGASSEQKMHWFLMRAGVREIISYFQNQERAALKSPAAADAYQQKMKKAYAKPKTAARDNRSFAEINTGLAVALSRAADDMAAERAAAILAKWVCDGSTPLGQCTGADLARFADKENAAAGGHLANAKFYTALRALVPEAGTVQQSVSAVDFLDIFDSAFNSAQGGA